MRKFMLLLSVLFLISCSPSSREVWLALTPAGQRYCRIDTAGTTIIPNGRLLTPLGRQIRTAPHPYGLLLCPDGSTVITANSGTAPLSITLIRDALSASPRLEQIPPGVDTDKDLLSAVFMGLAVSPDLKMIYVAGGQDNRIYRFDFATGQPLAPIDCAALDGDRDYMHGYIGDMVLTKDGTTLYAVDQIGFRLVVIDVLHDSIVANVPVGRYPFGLTLSPDEKEVYVANVGMFEYSMIKSLDPDNLPETSLDYPAFAYQSEEMIKGIHTDSLQVAGLGDPNVPESFSVWTVETATYRVTAKTKTGFLVGEMIEDFPAVGGSSPNSVVATHEYVFISNGNNDCISVIDTQIDTVVATLFLTPDERLGTLRGIIPFGLALSPDFTRLYIAESGINAVAVIDVESLQVLGHLPVGWFPSKLAVSPDGKKLFVANAKGFGSGANGGPHWQMGPEGSNIGRLMKGSVSIFDIPADAELRKYTQMVVANNFDFVKLKKVQRENNDSSPVPLYPGQKESPIKHIVFISKENRTYDEVFGQVAGGVGEPSLARFGTDAVFRNKIGQVIEGATVMPNHLKLAREFAISDNFYVDSDHSADGHRWLVCTYPNEWVETSVSASYGGQRSMLRESKAPGNLAFVGATGAIYPEDYNEAGSLWDHLYRHDIEFFNFGFGLELAPSYGEQAFKYTGVRHVINYPLPQPLYERSSKLYATYNTGIPDQFRADMFIKEFNDRWMADGTEMPAVLTVILPNDHGAGERPEDGYPFMESYMSDNDLALGRIVEFLSHTRYWKNMAIIVTEDDSQGGVDHVDAHRSILMLVSPFARRGYVGHHHYSFGSIFKTFWHILGIPYLNQYDYSASDMADLFTAQPDTTPYAAVPVDARVFDPHKALDPFDAAFNWRAVAESPVIDDPADMLKQSQEYDQKVKEAAARKVPQK